MNINSKDAGLISLSLSMAIDKWGEDAKLVDELYNGNPGRIGMHRLAEQFRTQCEDAKNLIERLSEEVE